MATNNFLSQLQRQLQSIWFNLIHVLLLLIIIVGLGLFFLLILINIKNNKMSSIYLLLENVNLFIFKHCTPILSWATRQEVLQHPQHPYFPR